MRATDYEKTNYQKWIKTEPMQSDNSELKRLVVIGDVHGKISEYAKITRQCDNQDVQSIQIGDMGFYSSYVELETHSIDPDRHKFFPGNHDDYHNLPKDYHLGSYGEHTINGISFFYIRGAKSRDKHLRTAGVDWWAEEQLSLKDCNAVVRYYRRERPELVLSHDCPQFVYQKMFGITTGTRSNTSILLDECYKGQDHKPKYWIFGHHHRNAIYTHVHEHGHTQFICLDELQTCLITKQGKYPPHVNFISIRV